MELKFDFETQELCRTAADLIEKISYWGVSHVGYTLFLKQDQFDKPEDLKAAMLIILSLGGTSK